MPQPHDDRAHHEAVLPFRDPNDHGLLERLRRGEEAAFAELVRNNTGFMLAAARRILRSEDEARDAVQEAFLQVFRGLARFHGEAPLAIWMRRIVINACLMRLRARRRRPEISVEELLPSFYDDGHRVDPGGPWSQSAIEALEREETRAFMREQIDRLPEQYRSVLLLRDIEELDTEETAAVLGITPGTAKVRLHRARQALRALLVSHLATLATLTTEGS